MEALLFPWSNLFLLSSHLEVSRTCHIHQWSFAWSWFVRYNIFKCDRVGRNLFENGLHVFEMFSETMSVLVENKHISIIGESLFWFPRCFGDRISFPFHIVLIASSLFLMINDRIHFVDFFFIVKFCQRFMKVRSIGVWYHFLVGSKESGMEDIMNLPRGMKLELIGHWSKDFCDNEWSFSFWSHFFIVLSLHVSWVQPHFVSFLNGVKVDFCWSAMHVLASSCAASASSWFLIKVFILSSTAGYFVFSNDNGRVIGDSPNMSLKGVFIWSVCHQLLCVNSIRCKAFGHSSG